MGTELALGITGASVMLCVNANDFGGSRSKGGGGWGGV